jgi:hypothetical protein
MRSSLAADLVGTWTGELIRPSPNVRRTNPAILRIFEESNRLRGALEVRGVDLVGSGDVMRSGDGIALSGRFGQRGLPIAFTLVKNGSMLESLRARRQLHTLPTVPSKA